MFPQALVKHFHVQRQAAGLEFLHESGNRAGGHHVALDFAILIDAGLRESEKILHGDAFAFQARNFGDVGYLAAAVAHAGCLDDHVDGGADLFADGAGRQFNAPT